MLRPFMQHLAKNIDWRDCRIGADPAHLALPHSRLVAELSGDDRGFSVPTRDVFWSFNFIFNSIEGLIGSLKQAVQRLSADPFRRADTD